MFYEGLNIEVSKKRQFLFSKSLENETVFKKLKKMHKAAFDFDFKVNCLTEKSSSRHDNATYLDPHLQPSKKIDSMNW